MMPGVLDLEVFVQALCKSYRCKKVFKRKGHGKKKEGLR